MVRAFVNTVGLSMEVYGSQFYFFEKLGMLIISFHQQQLLFGTENWDG